MNVKFLSMITLSVFIISSCGEEKKDEKKDEKKEEVEETVETLPDYSYTHEVKQEEVTAGWAVTIMDKGVTFETIQATLEKNYGSIGGSLGKMKKAMGEPFAAYHNWVDEKSPFDLQSGFLVMDSTIKVKAPMELMKTYSGKVMHVTLMGSYEQMMTVYADFYQYMTENNLTNNGAPWEVYVVDPMENKDTTQWHTEIYFPVK